MTPSRLRGRGARPTGKLQPRVSACGAPLARLVAARTRRLLAGRRKNL